MLLKKILYILRPTFILFFSYKMWLIVHPYLSWEWDVDFLATKQHIIHLDYYRYAFYTHIFSSLLVLPSGALLFSNWILTHYRSLHRIAGRTYVIALLLLSAPSGLIMAFYANGGWLAQMSFLILVPLWWYTTWKGYQTARQKQFQAHKQWMIRSYALSLSAVSLRLFQLLFAHSIDLAPEAQYILFSWLSWTVNLGLAEVLIRYQSRKVVRSNFHRYGESRLTRMSPNFQK